MRTRTQMRTCTRKRRRMRTRTRACAVSRAFARANTHSSFALTHAHELHTRLQDARVRFLCACAFAHMRGFAHGRRCRRPLRVGADAHAQALAQVPVPAPTPTLARKRLCMRPRGCGLLLVRAGARTNAWAYARTRNICKAFSGLPQQPFLVR